MIANITGLLGVDDLRGLHYLDDDRETANPFGFEAIRRYALLLLVGYLVYTHKTKTELELLALKTFVFSLLIYFLFIDFRVISDRLGTLFGVTEGLLFAYWVHREPNKNGQLLAFIATLFYVASEFFLRVLTMERFPAFLI